MWYRTIHLRGKLFALLMFVFISLASLSAQEIISGKNVRTGIWEDRQIEYLEGEIAVILKPGVNKVDVQALLQRHGATIKTDFDKLGWGLIELPSSVDVYLLPLN